MSNKIFENILWFFLILLVQALDGNVIAYICYNYSGNSCWIVVIV